MGHTFTFFRAAALTVGSPLDDIRYNTTADYWNATTQQAELNNISSSCVDTFQQGSMGVDYSSFPLRLNALLAYAGLDEDLKQENITSASLLNFVCDFDDEDKSLNCNFSNLYDKILDECKILDIRGVAENVRMPADQDDKDFLEGNCEELLGLNLAKKNRFNPETDWCPTYYDGKEGSVTFARIEISRSYLNGKISYDDDDKWGGDDTVNKWDSLRDYVYEPNLPSDGNGTIKFVVNEVPYCTAFDSCTEEEFFIMANAEADAYLRDQDVDAAYYNVTITHTPKEGKTGKTGKKRRNRRKTKSIKRALPL